MESFRYHDLGRIAYADALEYQTAAFEALLDAKAAGKKEDNQLFFCEHLPVLTIGKSGKGLQFAYSRGNFTGTEGYRFTI